MKYRIISVGKIKEPFYLNGIKEYLKRLKPYTNMELVDGLEEKIAPRAGIKEIEKCLYKEGTKLFNLIGDNEIVVLMDIQGEPISSTEWAGYIEELNMSSSSAVNLIIGGSFGVDERIKRRADRVLSFSQMTFPHQMAVLILTEQIYRAFKIIRNEPYHK
jgi:23S rRNA (pseudouridine1915-N3)-methyltransferase